jgi:hypothetical protein
MRLPDKLNGFVTIKYRTLGCWLEVLDAEEYTKRHILQAHGMERMNPKYPVNEDFSDPPHTSHFAWRLLPRDFSTPAGPQNFL